MLTYSEMCNLLSQRIISELGQDILIILYGSKKEIYDASTDVDVCVYKQSLNFEERKKIAAIVEKFHEDYGLKFDGDMIYLHKTSCDNHDFEILKKTPPFDMKNGHLIFTPIIMTREFLDSEEMRLRLLLNIFTVKSILIYGNMSLYEQKIAEMYDILLSYIMRSVDKLKKTDEALEILDGRQKKLHSYKHYLGYDFSDTEQKDYITNQLQQAINRTKNN